ncbi:hypothetical protein [Sporomusa sp.]|uniref:hypothetical protein n=1 Tax=Sporomusa sp. TaxID=2078658 RepID=UPI002CA991AA|nr:hypothetical protein [Sporomusa sp.]HWR45964.1 hypothetical protein [Sporomusa sp.]
MVLFAAVAIALTLLPLPAFCEETSATGIVNTYVQYTLDNDINTTHSKIRLSFVDDYSDFSFSYSRKFDYPVTPRLLAFSDVTFEGNRHDAFLSQANVGLEFTTKNHTTTLYKRIYEKALAFEGKYYFSFGGKFN